jgi:hypothetical protein
MTELKACPICKGTRICIDGGDNTYYPRCLDCGCTAPHDAWQTTRTPAPALAEAAEEVIKSATGAYNEKRTNVSKDKLKKLKDALAAYRDED